ncbi:MAG: DUF72 domain-containing protein [Planctomycetota bacterium]
MTAALRLGTSSWSEKGWVGSFYPRGTAPRDFLAHYATHFDTVEADNTYYAVPGRELVRGWESKLPAGFLMSAKFPRSIVHCGQGPQPAGERVLARGVVDEQRDAFLQAMRLMGQKCGPLVLQFPYFNRRAFSSPGPFLERLDWFLGSLPADFRYAVEVRNKAWVGSDLLTLLRGHGVALVLVDLPYMPHASRLAEQLGGPEALETADFLYVRLIGDRQATDALTRTFREIVLDRSAELGRWADFLRPAVARATETFVYANNHFAGHGPATIRELAKLLAQGEGA